MSTLVCPKPVTDSWSQVAEAVSSMSMRWMEYRRGGGQGQLNFALCITLYLNAPIYNAFRLTKDWVKQITSEALDEEVKNKLQLMIQAWGNFVQKYVDDRDKLYNTEATMDLDILLFSDIVSTTQAVYQISMKTIDLLEKWTRL
jgi:hypothetical protein